MLKRKNVARNR